MQPDLPTAPSLSLPVQARALLLGAATGLRSQTPTALLAVAASQGWVRLAGDPIGRRLGTPAGVAAAVLAAAGELAADKLPFLPSRLGPAPLLGRVVTGAGLGAAVVNGAGRPVWLGALLGGAGAGLSAFAGATLRSRAAERTGVPDPVWAVAEDLAAVALALAAVLPAGSEAAA